MAYVLNKPAIAAWKAETGKTSDFLAATLKVTPATLSGWLNGHVAVPLWAAFKLEDITGLPLRGTLVREVA